MSRPSYGTPGHRYRAACEPPPEPVDLGRCDTCGRRPRHPGERADLATDWILPGSAGPGVGHFCRGCAPAGPVVDLSCIRCGDGPLLAGDIAERPEHAEPLLTAAGWQLAGPTCPSCVASGHSASRACARRNPMTSPSSTAR